MLLSDVIKIEITNKNLKYYQRSNKDLNIGSIIFIPLDELSSNSGLKVDVKCDYCGIEFKMEYRKYLRSVRIINKNSCKSVDCSSLKVKESNSEKYGVENVMQLAENIDKARQTNLEKWGVDHPMQLKEIKDKIKNTNLIKYGTENPMQLDEFKNKVKKTNLIKYGSESPMQLDEFKNKAKKTNLKRYGVENYTHTDEYKVKSKKTNLEKYGVDNYTKTEECQTKIKKTNLEKYGFEYLFQSKEFRDLIKSSNLDKFGVEYYSQTDEFLEKIKKTCLERFGFENPMKSDDIKEKLKNSFLEKYGVDNPNKLDYIREKIKNTNFKNFGFQFPTQSPTIKEKIKNTNLKNYGVTNIMYSEEFRKQNFIISNHSNYLKFLTEDKTNEFKCDCGESHNFRILADNFYKRLDSNLPLCTVCYPISDSRSIKEEELYKFIQCVYDGEIIQSHRDKFEIDIYLPQINLGFEFNGLRWHSNVYRENDYHLQKTNYFKEKGIRIIHIWEDDFDFKKDIINSQIKNMLNKTESKIYARKCVVKEMKSVNDFLEKNHIQGAVRSVIKLGLYHDSELISVMTFDQFEGRKKMNIGEWNLNRFCSKLNTTVIGGASKLLHFFINKYNPNRIISYADADWSVGNLYDSLKFNKIWESKPDYKYVVGGKRIHKSNFRKSVTKISESKLNLPKVYDCGKIKFERII
jgi:hypothetical protein